MKKNIIFIALTALLLIFITGCKITKKIEDYTIDLSGLPQEVNLENFNIKDIKLLVEYNTNETEEVLLDNSMLNEEDVEKLNKVGNHEITVTYVNITKKFNIEICSIKYKVTFLDFYGNVFEEQYPSIIASHLSSFNQVFFDALVVKTKFSTTATLYGDNSTKPDFK